MGIYEVTVTYPREGRVVPDQSTQPLTLNGLASILASFIGPPVQLYFADRIRRFSATIWIPALCWALSLACFVLTLMVGIGAVIVETLIEWRERWYTVYGAALIIGAATDLLIATYLCLHLLSHRNNAFKQTTKLIDYIIIWTICTGLVTSIIAFVTLLTFYLAFQSFVWSFFGTLVSRSFSVTLLASLHARQSFNALILERTPELSPAPVTNLTFSAHTIGGTRLSRMKTDAV